jgi:glycosyltransferase involved in cell wall biosynthesis
VNAAVALAKRQVRATGRRVLGDSRLARRAAASARTTMATRLLTEPRVFDVAWYGTQARRDFGDVREAVAHYVRTGRLAGLSPNPLFEPSRKLEDDRRRLRGGYVPLSGFLRRARSPKARAHPLFDAAGYLKREPKAARHRFGAWGHFLEHASDGTPLPLPPTVGGMSTEGLELRYGPWRDTVARALAGWAAQTAVSDPPRVMPEHDAAAEKAFRAEVAGYPLPAPAAPGEPLVSVVTAVRNRPNLVLEAIASVTAQTLRDWEMVVVDDGSDDTTPDAVAEVARRDPRVKLLRRPGEGVSRARNAGASVARGRYLAWLDSDNTWAPDYLETMVKALSGRDLRAGYAACEMVSEDGVAYREFAFELEHLAVGNVVDLNVLVAERALVDEVGGFDPGLPRAVDYDLVYKLAKRTRIGYLPFLAVRYVDDDTDAHRISVKELKTWNYVVRERHVLDWDAVAAAVPGRVPGRLSVVVAGREEWRLIWATVLTLLRHTPADGPVDLEVVVVDGASTRTPTLLIAALEALDPRVRVIRTVANYNLAGGRNVGIAATTGEHVAVLAAGVTVLGEGWAGPLLEALAAPGTAAVSPVVTGWDHLVRWAGQVLPAWATLPVPFLGGHPLQDTRGLGERFEVPALAVGAVVVRAADAVAVRGFDPLYIDAYDDADFSLRVAAATGGACAVATGTRVVQLVHAEQRPDDVSVQNRRLFTARWRGPVARGDELWARAGLSLQGYRPRSPDNIDPDEPDYPHDTVVLEPVLHAVLPPGQRRWAVEVPDLPTRWPQLDDFGGQVAAALERRGIPAVSRRASGRNRTPAYLDDVLVTLRGVRPIGPVSGRPCIIVTSPFGRAPLVGEAERFDARVEDPLDDADALAARLVDTLAGIAAGSADVLGGGTGSGEYGDDHSRTARAGAPGDEPASQDGGGRTAGVAEAPAGAGAGSAGTAGTGVAGAAGAAGDGGPGRRGLSPAVGGLGGLQPR